MGYDKLVVSIKSSNVKDTIKANMEFSKKSDYPLHLGVTEAGPDYIGITKSSIAMGILLYNGIGDTIRVSLTGKSVDEVIVARAILKSLELIEAPELIACPTCGRKQIDVESIAYEILKHLGKIKKPIKIAVMGCEVNGPGEARDADIGIAGAKDGGIVFKKGKGIKRLKGNIVQEFIEILMDFCQ